MADEVVGTGYVEIRPKLDEFNRSLDRDLRASFSKLRGEAERASEGIENSLAEARGSADRSLRQIGGADVWGDLKREAARAGESVEDSFREAGRVADRSLDGVSTGRGMGGLKLAVAGLVTGLAAIGAGAALKSSVGAAADLGESMNAISVVLGDGADSFLRFGETAKSQLGITRTELNTSLVPMAALLKNAGMEGDALSTQLQALAQRATDTGSVLNRDTTEVLEKFGAAVRGEQEGVRALGVSFDDAAVRAKAVELGLAGATGEMSEAAKQQARLALIMEQTDQFAGDFAKTADSLPNTLKRLKASATEASVGFGEALLPAVAEVADGFVGLFDEIGPSLADLGGALADNLAPVFKALGPAVAKLVPLLSKVVGLVGKAFQALAPLIEPLLDVLTTAGEGIIDVLSTAIDALKPVIVVVGQILDRVGPVLGQMLASVGEALTTILTAVEPLLPPLGELIVALVDALAPILPAIVSALAGLAPPLAQLLTALMPLLIPLTQMITLLVDYGLAPAILAITAAITALSDALAWLAGVVADVVGTVIGWFRSLYDTLVGNSIIPDLITGILEWFGKLPIELVKLVASLIPKLIGKWIELQVAVVSKVTEIIGKVVEWFAGLPGKIVTALVTLAGAVGGVFTSATDTIRARVDGLHARIVQWFRELPGKIVDGLQFLAARIAGVFRFAWVTVRDGVDELIGKITGWFADLPGKIIDAVGQVADSIRGLGRSIINWILDGIEAIGGEIAAKLRSLIPSPGDLLGKIGGVAGKILDHGDVITRPTFALLSANSRPEVVIPLTKPSRAMELADASGLTSMLLSRGGGGMTVEFHGGQTFADSTDVDLVGQRLMAAFLTAGAA